MKLFACLLSVGLFAAVSAFRHTDRVDVTILRESYDTRERRSSDDASTMPTSLALSVSSLTKGQPSSASAVLRLQRHALLQPVLMGAGRQSFLHTPDLTDSAVYSDPSRQAVLIVRRNADNQYTLDGSFVHEEEEYQIAPLFKSRSRRSARRHGNKHRVFSLRRGGNASVSFVGDSVQNPYEGQPDRRNQEQGNGRQGQGRGQGQGQRGGRGKRQAVTNHILETAFIVDFSEYQEWVQDYGAKAVDELTLYYSYVAQGVEIRYNNVQKVDPSINIQFTVSYFTILTTSGDASYMEKLASSSGQVNSTLALSEFFVWLQGRADIPLADHYATFTALDLYSSDSDGNVFDIAGIAYTGTICTGSALSVTENSRNGLTAATAAHEIGHSLSADHDVRLGCDDNEQYIMSTSMRVPVTTSVKSNPWFFSTCSINSFLSYLDRVSCTRGEDQTTGVTALPSSGLLPGQTISRDQQCAFHYRNESSSFCESIQSGPSVGGLPTLCYGMLCSIPDRPGFCSYVLPQEYTACGDGKWCEQGVCVDIPTTTATTPTTTTTTPTTTTTTPTTTTTTPTTTTTTPTTTTTTPTTTTTTPTTTTTTPTTTTTTPTTTTTTPTTTTTTPTTTTTTPTTTTPTTTTTTPTTTTPTTTTTTTTPTTTTTTPSTTTTQQPTTTQTRTSTTTTTSRPTPTPTTTTTTTTSRTSSTRSTRPTRPTITTTTTTPTTRTRTPTTPSTRRPTTPTTPTGPRLVCRGWFWNRRCWIVRPQPARTTTTKRPTTTTTRMTTTVPPQRPANDFWLWLQRWLNQWQRNN